MIIIMFMAGGSIGAKTHVFPVSVLPVQAEHTKVVPLSLQLLQPVPTAWSQVTH